MNVIELDIMKSMVSILNSTIDIYQESGVTIMTQEQFDTRMKDLEQFEEETGFMLLNSPNCKLDIMSVIENESINNEELNECYDVENIITFSNQKEMVAYVDIVGTEVVLTYTDGNLSRVQTNHITNEFINIIKRTSIPYKTKTEDICIVRGKIVILDDKPVFYATDLVVGGNDYLHDNLGWLKTIGFVVTPNWFVGEVNSKKLQSTIDYVFEDMDEEEIPCNGIVFKFNDIGHSKMMSVMGGRFNEGIIYKKGS